MRIASRRAGRFELPRCFILSFFIISYRNFSQFVSTSRMRSLSCPPNPPVASQTSQGSQTTLGRPHVHHLLGRSTGAKFFRGLNQKSLKVLVCRVVRGILKIVFWNFSMGHLFKETFTEWMTNELIEHIKNRDYFYRKAKRNGVKDSWNIAKHLRNVTNSSIRQAKREFILGELIENENNAKKFWKVIKQVIPSNKSTLSKDILLKDNGTKIDKDHVADHINEFFY